MERKTRFKIALAVRSEKLGEYSITQFCEDHDCSRTMLYDVLNGRRKSERLERAVEDFITRWTEGEDVDLPVAA